MTIEQLMCVLKSKPRVRVARIVGRWLLLVILYPVKIVLKLPALPFLWLSNRLYDCHMAMFGEVGDIRVETEERELRDSLNGDDELEE